MNNDRTLRPLQLGERRFGAEHVAFDVDPEELVERRLDAILGHLGERDAQVVDPGVTDEDAQLAERVDGFPHRRPVIAQRAHVTLHDRDRTREFTLDVGQPFGRAIQDRNPAPSATKRRATASPNPESPPVTSATSSRSAPPAFTPSASGSPNYAAPCAARRLRAGG